MLEEIIFPALLGGAVASSVFAAVFSYDEFRRNRKSKEFVTRFVRGNVKLQSQMSAGLADKVIDAKEAQEMLTAILEELEASHKKMKDLHDDDVDRAARLIANLQPDRSRRFFEELALSVQNEPHVRI